MKQLVRMIFVQGSCNFHPQPSGHYSKSTFYVNTPVALTGAVIPTPVYRPDETFEHRHNHLHTNVVVGGGEDDVDGDVMRVKLPPPPLTAVDTRLCRNAGCEFYGTSEFSFFCSKCYSKLKQKSNAATSRQTESDGKAAKKMPSLSIDGFSLSCEPVAQKPREEKKC